MNSIKKGPTTDEDIVVQVQHENHEDGSPVVAKRRKMVDSDCNNVKENSTSYASISTTTHESIDSESGAESSLNTSDLAQENPSQCGNNSDDVEQSKQEINGPDSTSTDHITDNQDKVIEGKQEPIETIDIELIEPLVEHDPGKRIIRTTRDREYLIKLGPHQPVLSSYPRNQDLRKKKRGRRSFSAKWYEQYPFLEYSICKDAAFCFICSLFPDGPDRNQSKAKNWIDRGIRNWGDMIRKRKGKLASHSNSKAHKAALEDYQHFVKEAGRIDVILKQIQSASNSVEEESEEECLSDV